jgi:hypothetical protein
MLTDWGEEEEEERTQRDGSQTTAEGVREVWRDGYVYREWEDWGGG